MIEYRTAGSRTKVTPYNSGGDGREEKTIGHTPEKGKPFKRMGRKTTGLNPGVTRDMTAGLPGEYGTSSRAEIRLEESLRRNYCMERIHEVERMLPLARKSKFRSINKSIGVAFVMGMFGVAFAQDTNAGQATLAWDATSGAIGYKLHYGTNSGSYSNSIDAANATNLTLSDLTDGKKYYFAVTSYDYSGNQSGYSNEVSKTIAAATQYQLSVVTSGTGTGTVSGTGISCGNTCSASYASGTVLTLTAAPATGSTFAGWSGGGCSGTGSCTVTMNAATSVTATFNSTVSTYTITATAGSNGKIAALNNTNISTATSGTSTITMANVTKGASQAFSITPNTGYQVTGVSVDGVSVGAITSYTFSNVLANHTLSATFGAATSTSYTITASAGTGGTISPSGSVAVSSGGSKSFTITPSSGYTISDVKVDGTSIGAVSSYTFSNLAANRTISATFAAAATTTAHWKEITTSNTAGQYGTAKYMQWSPVTADATGKVTKLHISIKSFGSPTQIRLALYNQSGKKLTEAAATVTKAGYAELAVPAAAVTKGSTYYIAAQAASNLLYQFNCGSTSGGFEGANTFSNGFPSALPGKWSTKLLTAGMYIQ